MDELRNRRVLLVAPLPFFRVAGTPLNIRTMCRALTELGYEVHLATLPLGEDLVLQNLVYHRIPRLPFIDHVPIGFSFAKAIYNLVMIPQILLLLWRHRFVVVHAIEEAAFYSVPIARLFGIPAVMDLDSDLHAQLNAHNSWLARSLAFLVPPLRRLALRQSACAITVAESLTHIVMTESPQTPVSEIRDIPPDEVMRKPNFRLVDDLRRQLGLGASAVIVYTGNFDGRQGIGTLIQAMPSVLAKYPDTKLLLVGGEPGEIAQMRAISASLGVQANIHFAGKCPTDAMPEYMALASVLVSPRLEPLVTPLKIYAYMSSGRPIVATRLPTHTQVLDDASAVLVPPTVRGVAAGIVRTLENPKHASRLGQRAQRLVVERYSYNAFKLKLADAYGHAVETGAFRTVADGCP